MVDEKRSSRLATTEDDLAAMIEEALELKQPTRRSECRKGPRPCPWVGCRFHLLLRQNSRGGLRVDGPVGRPGAPETWPPQFQDAHTELERMVLAVEALANAETCALDPLEEEDQPCSIE